MLIEEMVINYMLCLLKQISENEKVLKPIPLPLPQDLHPKDEGKGDCKWEPPTEVKVIGSWANGTAVQGISEVDVVLIMPEVIVALTKIIIYN